MSDRKKVFLVDLDNTLIDTEKIRQALGGDKTNLNLSFADYFFPEARNLLNILKAQGEVFIYSGGDQAFQLAKIKGGAIDELIDQPHLIIVPDKLASLSTVLPKFKDAQITMIDDRADILSAARQINPTITCICIKIGKYQDSYTATEDFDFVTDSLGKVLDYFYPYHIKPGLTEKQIDELVAYTKKDPEIQKYTHDAARFKNRKSVDKWLAKGRIIYSLVDSEDNMLGIIWFGQKDLPAENYIENFDKNQYQTTFAIRMYGAARGKGLAKKFMADCFKNYLTENNGSIWLLTAIDNIPALKLYQSFGFKTVTKVDQEGKIIMIYG